MRLVEFPLIQPQLQVTQYWLETLPWDSLMSVLCCMLTSDRQAVEREVDAALAAIELANDVLERETSGLGVEAMMDVR